MLELPEVSVISRQLTEAIVGKTVEKVLPPTKPHKFCFFSGDPAAYDSILKGAKVDAVEGFGIFVEISFDNGAKLCFNDGVNARVDGKKTDFQLKILFKEGGSLDFSVAMYGGIYVHGEYYDNEYYTKSKNAVPIDGGSEFREHFFGVFDECDGKISAKAFLATEQRFPGIGNGALQDILFFAKINPRRKLSSLTAEEKDALWKSTVDVLAAMTAQGGRDTEKDIYGNNGGYRTIMSKKALEACCPACGADIVKDAYMGGSCYYCPICQPK